MEKKDLQSRRQTSVPVWMYWESFRKLVCCTGTSCYTGFIYFSQLPLNDSMKRTHLWDRKPNIWGWRTHDFWKTPAKTCRYSERPYIEFKLTEAKCLLKLRLQCVAECSCQHLWMWKMFRQIWHLISCCQLDSKSQKTETLNNFWYIDSLSTLKFKFVF